MRVFLTFWKWFSIVVAIANIAFVVLSAVAGLLDPLIMLNAVGGFGCILSAMWASDRLDDLRGAQ